LYLTLGMEAIANHCLATISQSTLSQLSQLFFQFGFIRLAKQFLSTLLDQLSQWILLDRWVCKGNNITGALTQGAILMWLVTGVVTTN